jgi:hypothetical protein
VSTSDLYVLNGKSTRHLAAFRNGWGSGPRAWDHLAEKYIPVRPAYSMDEKHLEKVWALAGDKRLQDHERAVLMITFDKAFVPVGALTNAAAACEKFGAECEDGRRVNHWPAIGAALRQATETNLGRHARGVCLTCTSVADYWSEPVADWLAGAWSIYAEPA